MSWGGVLWGTGCSEGGSGDALTRYDGYPLEKAKPGSLTNSHQTLRPIMSHLASWQPDQVSGPTLWGLQPYHLLLLPRLCAGWTLGRAAGQHSHSRIR